VTATHVRAQSYPNQAINLAIPLAPVDATDVAARTMGEELSKLLKVPIVAVSRPAGGMTIGPDRVGTANKDRDTSFLTTNAARDSNRILNPETASYDPLKDLTPLGLSTRTPILLAVRQDAPYKSFGELVEFAKKNPGKLRVGTVGPGSAGHLNVEM